MKKSLFNPLLTLIGTIFSLWGLSIYNLLDYVPIIPVDKKYDSCLILYTAAFSCTVEFVKYVWERWLNPFSYLKVIFCSDKHNANINARPLVHFNSEGMAEIEMVVEMYGKSSNFNGKKLVIKSPNFADIQCDSRMIGVELAFDEIAIDFDKICKNREKVDVRYSYRILFCQNVRDCNLQEEVYPVLSKKNFRLRFKNNTFDIKSEGRN